MKIFLLLCITFGFAYCADWSYAGPKGVDNWHETFPDCHQRRQSPIDIPFELEYQNFSTFSMTGYEDMAASGLELTNNGHTAVITIHPTKLGVAKVSGGGLGGNYIAVQLHFHWGQNDLEGSEHTFRGRKYPLELHIVHYKEEYQTFSDSLNKSDGLAVLGFFFETDGSSENMKLKSLTDALDDISFKDQKKSVTNIDFSDLIPTMETPNYYRYMGSLTTPSCNEIVVWTVFENKNTISSDQLRKFRQLYETKDTSHPMIWNYRPTQNLYGRKVYKNFNKDVPDSWHWGYEGTEAPNYWKDYYPTCSGEKQSPINIPNQDTTDVHYNPRMQLDTLEFRNYDKAITGEIFNNGHTIQVNIDQDDIYLMNGGLSDRYIAEQLHFHWGHDNSEGSEHTHNGKAYPLEMHIVHYKAAYGDFSRALSKPDGLAVVGFFFQADAKILNRNYDKIVNHLPDVKYKDASKTISGFSLKDLTYEHNLPLNASVGLKQPYYRYEGGLTTPPCIEIVTWSVMAVPIQITSQQIAAFRDVSHIEIGTINSGDKIKMNYRPVQDLTARKVYYSTELIVAGSSGLLPSMLCTTAILLISALL